MTFSRARWWFVLACAGCAQIAGFEDLRGVEGSSVSGGGGASSGGRPSSGGRAGSGAGATAGALPDGGDVSNPGAGAAGAPDVSSGGEPTTGPGDGGALSGGAPDNTGGTSGGSANGGTTNGGAPNGGSDTGGGTTGGSDTGTGGAATGGTTGGATNVTGGRSGGGAKGCGELLYNGDFASGDTEWVKYSEYPNFELNVHSIIPAGDDSKLMLEDVEPHSDDYLLWLGGVPNGDRNYLVSVEQMVTIPEEAEELVFSGFARIATKEIENDDVYDSVFVELRTIDDELGWQFAAYNNQHAGGGWFAIDPIDPYPDDIEQLRGDTLKFMVYSRTDEAGVTDFWFDTLSLVADCTP